MRICCSEPDVGQFAEWSGDCNPLHVDPAAAKRTSFGRTITHGILSVISALKAINRPGAVLTSLDVEFRGAVVPGREYEVDAAPTEDAVAVELKGPDGPLALMNCRFGSTGSTPSEEWTRPIDRGSGTPARHPMPAPDDHTADDFLDPFESEGLYVVPQPPESYLAGGALHPVQARVLGLCSYLIGMVAPGLRSLFTKLDLRFCPNLDDASELFFRVKAKHFDPAFRLLDLTLEVGDAAGRRIAAAEMRAYVRFSPVVTDLDALRDRVSGSTHAMAEKVALVCGGSRGLGADLAAAFALAGCRVYVNYRNDGDAARDLSRRLEDLGAKIELVQGDCGDRSWCEATARTIAEKAGRLDYVILNACAPPGQLRIGPESSEAFSAYLSKNLPLATTPLASCLPLLHQSSGVVVDISSSFVESAPPGFGHYVAVKQATEASTRSAVLESKQISSLVVRPPRLQTSWNDTPTGVLGTIPSDWVAAHTVNRLAAGLASGSVEILAAFAPFKKAKLSARRGSIENHLVIAATFTAEPVLAGVNFWLEQLNLSADVKLAPYGQVLQELLNPTSQLSSNSKGMNIVLVRVADWLHETAEEKLHSVEFVRGFLADTVREYEQAMRTHRSHAKTETLLVVCPSRIDAAEAAPLITNAESELAASLHGLPGVQVMVAADFHDAYGVRDAQVHDPLREKVAHIPYLDAYWHVLATLVMRRVHRKLTPVRKVVVTDCDNTIWRGVVGEVGHEGLEFNVAHCALHGVLGDLAQNGVLIGLCSKNEEADVWSVFENRSDFGLKRETVVASAINWLPKSQNLRSLAQRLNLGLDSFIFIDDNPVECAEVRANAPEVLVLQWPEDPALGIAMLRHAWEFDRVEGTKEDQKRTQLYKEEFRRQELRAETLTFKDFISSLGLVVDIEALSADDLRRASQLTLRTNQFNFTTKRREAAELQALGAGGNHILRTVKVRDRFGDYGLVGFLIVELAGDRLVVDTFLLSCRVLGRGVEHRMIAEIGRIAREQGATTVHLRVEATARNLPARTFLDAVAPAEGKASEPALLACDVSAEFLAQVSFEPTDHAPEVPQEAEGTAKPKAAPALSPRARERQIAQAAFELATINSLWAAIVGLPQTARVDQASISDLGTNVYDAFARTLKVSRDRVREIDRLERLGCDSFNIVEITVALASKYPWLPSTLLFEHQSVSEIVDHLTQLAKNNGSAAPAGGHAPSIRTASGPDVDDIAVVGMDVRCAGADSPDELWELLNNGRIAVKPVPVSRPYFFGELHDVRPHWAGMVDGIDAFDPEFFGIAPREASQMDPQLRLFLEVAWGALEDAGQTGVAAVADTAVFVGAMYADYGYRANVIDESNDNPYRCWEHFSLANRLSQLLGLSGPSLAVDTACSSSGTAIHLACQALRAGTCSSAIVGGVNLILDPDRLVSLGRLGILSNQGRCLPFGAAADGAILGEGVAAVVLRPLKEAIRRSDRIYGVIKGTGASTGHGTVGFTAPNPQAQAIAIRRSIAAAGIDPRTINYVETHGTGTVLGDPIEVRGLTLAYSDPALWDRSIEIEPSCGIGSIKANVGHLEAGAALLGLVKILLQLDQQSFAPSICSDVLNPHIPFDQIPFRVQRTPSPWTRSTAVVGGVTTTLPRRGGLNSFGVGGANVHVIVEEAPTASEAPNQTDRPTHVLTLSARREDSLRESADRLAEYLRRRPELTTADVCWSANVGRRNFEHRLGLVVSDRQDMIARLEQFAKGDEPAGLVAGERVRPGSTTKVAFLFTGQGSQYASMGRQLYDTEPTFRAALDRCAEILAPMLPRPLLEVLFAAEGTDDAKLLNQTGFTQPALFAIEYAASEMWRSWGIEPGVVMGHSVGEVAALCIAGGVSLEDGLKLIEARGRLMQALPAGGAMFSIMTNEEKANQFIAGYADRVSIAAINGPEHVVISGVAAALDEITAKLKGEGIRFKQLAVSHAFHSPLMEPMIDEYAAVIAAIKFAPPRIPLVSGVLGTMASDELTKPGYWIDQIRKPVRFCDGMRAVAQNAQAFLEVGPQPVLLGMGRHCVAEGDETRLWLATMKKDADAWQSALLSLATLHVNGVEIDWKRFDRHYSRRRVRLPRYPFHRGKHWIDANRGSKPVGVNGSGSILNKLEEKGVEHWVERWRREGLLSADEALLVPKVLQTLRRTEREQKTTSAAPSLLYDVLWRERPQSVPNGDSQAPGAWLVVGDEGNLSAALCGELSKKGKSTTLVSLGNAESIASAFAAVSSRGVPIEGVVLLGGPAMPPKGSDLESLKQRCEASLLGAASVLKRLAGLETGKGGRFWMATRGAIATDGENNSPVDAGQTMLWGFGRTAVLEYPEHWGGMIDVDPVATEESQAGFIADQLLGSDGEDQIVQRGDRRQVARLARREELPASAISLRTDGTYLITGGVGALGVHVAKWLASHGVRHLLLTSRRGMETPGAAGAVDAIKALGASVEVIAADVSTPSDVDRMLAAASADRPLRGIVHAAGIDRNTPLATLDEEQLWSVLAPKVAGASLLDERTRDADLDLFVCFSSIAAVIGAGGHAPYGAANAYLDGLVLERRRQGLCGLAVNWGPWAGGGMANDEALARLEQIGNHGIVPADALRSLDAMIASNAALGVVADIDWDRFLPVYEARRPSPLLCEASNPAAPLKEASRQHSSSAEGNGAPWAKKLLAIPPANRLSELVGLLRSETAKALGFSGPADVSLDRTFTEMGLDSLLAVDFARRLQKHLGVRGTSWVFDFPRVEALAERLLVELPNGAATAESPATSRMDAGPRGGGTEWIGQLQPLSPEERRPKLKDLLATEVARTLGLAGPAQVSRERTFTEMGMDSLLAVGFSTSLQKRLGVRRSAYVFDYPTIDALTDYLLGAITMPEAAPPVTQAATKASGVVGYDAGVEREVHDFLKTAFPKRSEDLLLPRWRWMFAESARRLGIEPKVWMYCDQGRVVGHHGAIPVKVKLGSEERLSSWQVESMVLDEYRSQSIGGRLVAQGSDELGFSLSLGQTPYSRQMLLNLGWVQVADLQTSQCLLRPANVLRGKLAAPAALAADLAYRAYLATMSRLHSRSPFEVRAVERFDKRHDRLWKEVSKDIVCSVVRDASFLNWKWVEQPGQNLLRLELMDGDESKGVAVIAIQEPNEAYAYRRGLLVDVVAPLSDEKTVRQLVWAAIDAARAHAIDAMTCLHADKRLTKLLGHCGFLKRKPGRHLVINPAGLSDENRRVVLNEDSWFLTQADSDIDRPE